MLAASAGQRLRVGERARRRCGRSSFTASARQQAEPLQDQRSCGPRPSTGRSAPCSSSHRRRASSRESWPMVLRWCSTGPLSISTSMTTASARSVGQQPAQPPARAGASRGDRAPRRAAEHERGADAGPPRPVADETQSGLDALGHTRRGLPDAIMPRADGIACLVATRRAKRCCRTISTKQSPSSAQSSGRQNSMP